MLTLPLLAAVSRSPDLSLSYTFAAASFFASFFEAPSARSSMLPTLQPDQRNASDLLILWN